MLSCFAGNASGKAARETSEPRASSFLAPPSPATSFVPVCSGTRVVRKLSRAPTTVKSQLVALECETQIQESVEVYCNAAMLDYIFSCSD